MDVFTKAAELGIEAGFTDGQGHRHTTAPDALQIVIDAMPVRASHHFVDGPVVVRAGVRSHTHFETAASPLRWEVVSDLGVVAEGESNDRVIAWPTELSGGTYRLKLTDVSLVTEEVPFLVVPPRAFNGDFESSWILAAQLYGVRSSRNWGIGDFTDLAGLIELGASFGAGGIGLNPLHVLFDDRPGDCSPYSPNSRLFLNPLYIDAEKIPDLPASFVADNAQEIAGVRQSDLVDYAGAAKLKWRALRSSFEAFRISPEGKYHQEFAAFREQRGLLLLRFACFEVLRHKFSRPWWDWPNEWQHPDDAKCAELRGGADAVEVEFIEFVQWVADRQLKACRIAAVELGMKVGLYLDIAVGVQSDGFDAWNEQVAISRRLAVGAPPDQLNTAGQNWGLAGFNAAGLELRYFEPFRQMLQASMRHAGAVRLDHVLGLNRLYLVPHGFAADNGVYVRMPLEALLAVTAQESVAHRCVVIGEDLGTVPDGFREKLAEWGIWSYRVMMFERDHHGAFLGADRYSSDALVTFNTHDLPTFAGWQGHNDLALKHSLGIDPGESGDARHHAVRMLSEVLRHHAIETDDFYAAVELLAQTRSRLLAISLEDLLGVVDQPNIPGTVNEHPNWRRKLPVAVSEIFKATNLPALRAAVRRRSIAVNA